MHDDRASLEGHVRGPNLAPSTRPSKGADAPPKRLGCARSIDIRSYPLCWRGIVEHGLWGAFEVRGPVGHTAWSALVTVCEELWSQSVRSFGHSMKGALATV
eukprot:349838-Chlamydomonas_euryale.AAC.3